MANKSRKNYQVTSILAKGVEQSCDSWATGLNANQLVLGPSGAGKTRDFLKPNLLQMGSSFVVLDTKGSLQREVGPFLKNNGYEIQVLDFAKGLSGNVGYDPLRYVTYEQAKDDEEPRIDETSVLNIACTVVPDGMNAKDPFWDKVAQNVAMAFVLLAVERAPKGTACFNDVVSLYNGLYEGRDSTGNEPMRSRTNTTFESWAANHPHSQAVARWCRAKGMCTAEKMWSSILGIIDTAMNTFITRNAQEMYERANQVDFTELAKRPIALFVTISDHDMSMRPLVNLFITQAFHALIYYADTECAGGRLAYPVRFFLDDFSNLKIPNIEELLSVVRSREIWITMLCQSIMQLNAQYGDAKAASIVANCDTQLVLGFCDNKTAEFYSLRACQPPSNLLNSKLSDVWLFVRGFKPRRVQRYDLEDHPRYSELPKVGR